MRWNRILPFHQILFLRQNSWKYSASAIAEVAKSVYFSKIFNWNPPFRMLKQHLMKQKMPHFFIRWIFILCKVNMWIRLILYSLWEEWTCIDTRFDWFLVLFIFMPNHHQADKNGQNTHSNFIFLPSKWNTFANIPNHKLKQTQEKVH